MQLLMKNRWHKISLNLLVLFPLTWYVTHPFPLKKKSSFRDIPEDSYKGDEIFCKNFSRQVTLLTTETNKQTFHLFFLSSLNLVKVSCDTC